MHVMLDLETMGNSSNAAIIAIGAVAFNEKEIVGDYYTQISLESSVEHGMKMDASTVIWWLKQSDNARSAFKDNEKASELPVSLVDFSAWVLSLIETHGDVNVWGNGVAFDNVILSNAYKACHLRQPWNFWNDRCYRTLKSTNLHIKMIRSGTHHNALDDAKSQALHLMDINANSATKFL
ncbi:MAG: 3'-5' exonuclease [Shewanella sp.]